jgi:hypothetical protein
LHRRVICGRVRAATTAARRKTDYIYIKNCLVFGLESIIFSVFSFTCRIRSSDAFTALPQETVHSIVEEKLG